MASILKMFPILGYRARGFFCLNTAERVNEYLERGQSMSITPVRTPSSNQHLINSSCSQEDQMRLNLVKYLHFKVWTFFPLSSSLSVFDK